MERYQHCWCSHPVDDSTTEGQTSRGARVAADDEDRADGSHKASKRGFDLADLKVDLPPRASSTADTEIASAVAAAKADRIGGFARGDLSETTARFLKRAMIEADPMRAAIEAAGIFRGGAAEQAMREALGGTLASQAAATAVTGTLADKAMVEEARGSLIDRTAREIVEAERKMSDLVLGRTVADHSLASAVAAAQGRIGQLDWGSQYATGRAAMAALEDSYAALGLGRNRDRLLGAIAGVGSLAPIATGLIDQVGAMRLRTGEMLLETQRRLNAEGATGTIGYALRAGYGDLFPAMRAPRGSEIEAVIAASRSMEALRPYPDWAAEARARFEALTTPWVRTDLPDASIAAMARLTVLDRLVDHVAPADTEVVEGLRARLGDYRDAPDPEPATLADPIARTGYQLDLGFDPVLTVLPTAVVASMFAPFSGADAAVTVDADALENAIRMLIKRLEQALRRFIAARLQAHYGADWFDRLPSEIRRAWSAGRQRDIDEGRAPDELIAYADIDHYRRIIEHPDRWGAVFEPVFKDQGAIRETLRRIAVIRNPGAHFRAVTVEDLIVLRAEGAHLAKWLGVRLGG